MHIHPLLIGISDIKLLREAMEQYKTAESAALAEFNKLLSSSEKMRLKACKSFPSGLKRRVKKEALLNFGELFLSYNGEAYAVKNRLGLTKAIVACGWQQDGWPRYFAKVGAKSFYGNNYYGAPCQMFKELAGRFDNKSRV